MSASQLAKRSFFRTHGPGCAGAIRGHEGREVRDFGECRRRFSNVPVRARSASMASTVVPARSAGPLKTSRACDVVTDSGIASGRSQMTRMPLGPSSPAPCGSRARASRDMLRDEPYPCAFSHLVRRGNRPRRSVDRTRKRPLPPAPGSPGTRPRPRGSKPARILQGANRALFHAAPS